MGPKSVLEAHGQLIINWLAVLVLLALSFIG
jgi:hypothetical protein